jgi:hypothetical protein
MRASMLAQAALFGHFHQRSFNVERLRRSQPCPFRVKLRRTQYEQISSELPLKADIAEHNRHISRCHNRTHAPRGQNVRGSHRHMRAPQLHRLHVRPKV